MRETEKITVTSFAVRCYENWSPNNVSSPEKNWPAMR